VIEVVSAIAVIAAIAVIGMFWLFRKPYTVEVDDLADYCFTLSANLWKIRRRLRQMGYEINYPLQHIVKTKYGIQLIGARRVVNDHQYHIRVFRSEKGYRIYCHYEYTPEARPWEHYVGEGYRIACEEAERVFKEFRR